MKALCQATLAELAFGLAGAVRGLHPARPRRRLRGFAAFSPAIDLVPTLVVRQRLP